MYIYKDDDNDIDGDDDDDDDHDGVLVCCLSQNGWRLLLLSLIPCVVSINSCFYPWSLSCT